MFYDFTRFHSEEVIEYVFFTAIPFAFTDRKHEVAFTQHLVDFSVLEHVVLGSEVLYGFYNTTQTIVYSRVVLVVLFGTDVFCIIPAKVNTQFRSK